MTEEITDKGLICKLITEAMNKETLKQKLSVIISDTEMSGNEKRDEITTLFETEQYLNMQYYMEYCVKNGYVTPKDWIEKHKHF